MTDQPSEPVLSETERFLADTIRSIESLDALDLQAVEPATVFVAKSDGA
jgi:hypothetical protein